ncbi:hypothetical protein GCM10023318_20700 [Nocardia callitridis]|uniref:Uncharacterized protein n=1 Tax=Nocardia callitridis TaxID=648753 RepID=A0ABP9K6M6_9NOCA
MKTPIDSMGHSGSRIHTATIAVNIAGTDHTAGLSRRDEDSGASAVVVRLLIRENYTDRMTGLTRRQPIARDARGIRKP